MAATAHKLDNLVAILDRNEIQATGPIVQRFNTNPLPEKFRAFGWHVSEIDGHDMRAILEALDLADAVVGQPKVIIAKTIKGAGVSFAENTASFHNAGLTAEQFAMASRELSVESV
jgi:transketolase